MVNNRYVADALRLLKELVATPSVSRDEALVADILERELRGTTVATDNKTSSAIDDKTSSDARKTSSDARKTLSDARNAPLDAPRTAIPGTVGRVGNNVWIISPDFREDRPTLLLNAHLDTVKPSASWTRDPFQPTIEGDRLYGLGSNDCGGGLVSLLQAYRIIVDNASTAPDCGALSANSDVQSTKNLPRDYNLIYLASAEEEVSGANGVQLALQHLPKIDVAIVGEPTGLQPAIAEKGLMVVDAVAHGKAGHAARNEGVNAIYEALDDLLWLRSCKFDRVSPLLGEVKVSVTVIDAGSQHNVVPDACRYVIDVRTNELYTNEEALQYLQSHVKSTLTARSFRLSSSHIDAHHPLVERCLSLGLTPFGSPTLSDQALMPFPSLKLGPGESSRSHTADEFICISEIEKAIEIYTRLICG